VMLLLQNAVIYRFLSHKCISNRLETMNSNLGYISDRALFSYSIICGNYLFRN
jgi:hypothetical protein